MTPTCPICGESVRLREENKSYPFCSRRCQLIDLGHWLNEDYRIPGEPAEDEDGSEGRNEDERDLS